MHTRKRCICFTSVRDVPVHPALNAILDTKIFWHSISSLSTLTALSLFFNKRNYSASASFLPLFILIHPSYTFLATGQIYSSRMQSLSSHHSVTLSENVCCHRTPTQTHRNTHADILYRIVWLTDAIQILSSRSHCQENTVTVSCQLIGFKCCQQIH